MDLEMMAKLISDGEDASFKVVDAQSDPIAWAERELEKNEDLTFTPIAQGQWKARKLTKNRLLDVLVTIEDATAEVLVTAASLVPAPETVDNVRIYQMLLNGRFRIRGFKMAQAGEPLSFLVRHAIQNEYDLNEIVGVAVASMSNHLPHLKSVLDGEDPRAAFEANQSREKSGMFDPWRR